MSKRKFEKVICVGLPKTGTTTLGKCLEILGYSKAPYDLELVNQVSKDNLAGLEIALQNWDCFEDWPWPIVYQEVYKLQPNSAYILTVRKNSETWLSSLRKHTKRNPNPNSKRLRKVFFGATNPYKQELEYKRFYDSHNSEVVKFFSSKTKKFLVVCWEKGDGWEQLCNFLDIDLVVDCPFPHANSSQSRENLFYQLKKNIKKIIKMIQFVN